MVHFTLASKTQDTRDCIELVRVFKLKEITSKAAPKYAIDKFLQCSSNPDKSRERKEREKNMEKQRAGNKSESTR